MSATPAASDDGDSAVRTPSDESDNGIVANAFLRQEYAFVGIADVALDSDMLHPFGLFLVCSIFFEGIYKAVLVSQQLRVFFDSSDTWHPVWVTFDRHDV